MMTMHLQLLRNKILESSTIPGLKAKNEEKERTKIVKPVKVEKIKTLKTSLATRSFATLC